MFNPLSTNPTKWSNILKQFVCNLTTNCLSVFNHFMNLTFKGLRDHIFGTVYPTNKEADSLYKLIKHDQLVNSSTCYACFIYCLHCNALDDILKNNSSFEFNQELINISTKIICMASSSYPSRLTLIFHVTTTTTLHCLKTCFKSFLQTFITFFDAFF